jgi:hypothetical protein
MRPGDLIVLVADANMKAATEGLLSRRASLRLTQFSHRVIVHPHRDPGCRLQGHELLRTMQRTFRFALLMFDLDGCGVVGMDRTSVEAEVEAKLSVSGWKDRSAAIVIAPELEIWVWADSPWVDRVLAWQERSPALRPWLVSEGMAVDERGKPADPKAAMEKALVAARKPRSSALYQELAENVNLDRCRDPSFIKLMTTLRKWFGQ